MIALVFININAYTISDMPSFTFSKDTIGAPKFKQVVKVIWHKAASPTQMDGSIVFAMWHQCALPWGHSGAMWRTRLNLCFLWPTQVHNPNSKSIGSAAFTQLMAGCHRAHWRHLANTRAEPAWIFQFRFGFQSQVLGFGFFGFGIHTPLQYTRVS